ncbi:YrdB family protein [Rhodococcus sp. NPDC058514]|uniref:YrdB family protein n=1 Tax=unclassified Rhodococcus (in: high G+C Gram-positive bacteria) TaxID=192944 RepID=UPI00364B5F91
MTELGERPQEKVGPLEIVAFLCELAMLVLLTLAGVAAMESLLGRVLVAIALPAAAAGIWSVWMAPTSRRRLANPSRLYAQAALFAVAGLIIGLTVGWLVGAVFFVVSTAVFAERFRRELRTR